MSRCMQFAEVMCYRGVSRWLTSIYHKRILSLTGFYQLVIIDRLSLRWNWAFDIATHRFSWHYQLTYQSIADFSSNFSSRAIPTIELKIERDNVIDRFFILASNYVASLEIASVWRFYRVTFEELLLPPPLHDKWQNSGYVIRYYSALSRMSLGNRNRPMQYWQGTWFHDYYRRGSHY